MHFLLNERHWQYLLYNVFKCYVYSDYWMQIYLRNFEEKCHRTNRILLPEVKIKCFAGCWKRVNHVICHLKCSSFSLLLPILLPNFKNLITKSTHFWPQKELLWLLRVVSVQEVVLLCCHDSWDKKIINHRTPFELYKDHLKTKKHLV